MCQVRTCGRNEPIERGDGDYSATKTKEIIMAYETFYGTEFPLTKIGECRTRNVGEPSYMYYSKFGIWVD